MALVGEDLDEGDEICGAVVSLRSKVDRIQLWTRSKEDVEKINGIGRKLVKLLDVSEADGIGLEFQVRPILSSIMYLPDSVPSARSTTMMIAPCRTSSLLSRHFHRLPIAPRFTAARTVQ